MPVIMFLVAAAIDFVKVNDDGDDDDDTADDDAGDDHDNNHDNDDDDDGDGCCAMCPCCCKTKLAVLLLVLVAKAVPMTAALVQTTRQALRAPRSGTRHVQALRVPEARPGCGV